MRHFDVILGKAPETARPELVAHLQGLAGMYMDLGGRVGTPLGRQLWHQIKDLSKLIGIEPPTVVQRTL